MAVLTATVTDTAGHTDTGTARAVGASRTDNAGIDDAFSRQAIADTLDESAGQVDSTPRGGAGNVSDDAGLTDTVAVATASGATVAGLPRLVVQMAIGGTTPTDPNAGSFLLGSSQLGTGTLGAIAWVDVAADVVSVSTTPSPGGVTDTASPGSAQIVLENYQGFYDPENLTGPYAIDVGQHVRIRAEWAGVMHSLFYGYIDDITPDYGWNPVVSFSCTDGLAQLGRVKVREQPPSFAGDRTDQRLDRILTEADWPPSLRSLERGLAVCQADTYGDNALPLAQRIVDTELGEHFTDGDGRYVFYNRTHVYTAARSTTVQALFTDSGTDIDMQAVTSSRQRGDLFNQAVITRQGDGAVEQFYEDPASRLTYGPQTFPRQAGTMLASDEAALELCRWIVARFRQPGTRLSDLSVDATSQGMWDQLLGLRRLDRVRMQRTYGTAAVVVDKQVLVESVAWSITGTSWALTVATRPADDFKPFVLGTSQLGTGVLV